MAKKGVTGVVVTGWRGAKTRRPELTDAQTATVIRVLVEAFARELYGVLGGEMYEGVRIYEGGAQGVDKVVREFADAKGIHVVTVRADWTVHGRAAGPKRNKQMVELALKECQHVVGFAFPHPTESLGTWDCVQRMAELGVSITVEPLPVYEGK